MTVQMSLSGCRFTSSEWVIDTNFSVSAVQAYPHKCLPTTGTAVLKGGGNRALGSAVQYPKTVDGYQLNGFSDKWYGRLHVLPASIKLGNLLTTQNRQLTVWNANFGLTTLTNIANNAGQGITIDGVPSLPLIVQPLKELNYTLIASLSGAPVINGEILFNFGLTTLKTTITGNRVVVWPFSPQEGYIESLEWLTDVIRAKGGEQRVALRDAPRQGFEYSYTLNSYQASKARAMTVGWAQRPYGLPVWHEAQYIGEVAADATRVDVDTRYADYRVGSPVLLWTSDDEYEAVVVSAVGEQHLDLELPVSKNMAGVYAIPVRYARSTETSFTLDGNQYAKVRSSFAVSDNKRLQGSVSLPTYKGLPVLTDAVMDVGGHEDKVTKQVTTLDNGMADPILGSLYNTTDQYFNISWDISTREGLWRVRQLLHSLRGKQQTFWLPAPTHDLKLTADIDSSSSGITVKSFGGSLFYSGFDIEVLQRNGVRTFHTVNGVTGAGQDEILNLSASSGINVLVSDAPKISLMYKVRLDADRIEINYKASSHVTIRVPVKEVEN